MSDKPEINYFKTPTQSIKPTNLIVPYLKNGQSTFTKKMTIELINPNKSGKIYYQINGKNATEYKTPITIKNTAQITSWVCDDDLSSYKLTTNHKKVNDTWSIKLNSLPHEQYKGEYYKELIDQQYGGSDFRTGKWQGFYAQDLNVEIDLKKKTKINSVSLSCLQDANSWIWYPTEVEFYYSNNGKTWIKFDLVKNTVSPKKYGGLSQKISSKRTFNGKARYIKIIAKNIGNCPEWHPGRGNASFIFADEIEVR